MAVPLVWPARLGALRALCAADEVASTFRHQALNEAAGVGALLFRLRRQLTVRFPESLPVELATTLDTAEARLTSAPARFAARLLPSSPPDSARTDLVAACTRVLGELGNPGELQVENGVSTVAVIDSDELAVALCCLVENAIEATAAGGALRVSIAADDVRHQVTVSDDGIAIPGDIAERMLDAFFTTWPGHGGLGMKIARRIAQRWGGELLVTPLDPRGLRVTLVLPRA